MKMMKKKMCVGPGSGMSTSRSWSLLSKPYWNVAVCFGLCVLIASAAVATATVAPAAGKIKTTSANPQNSTQENGADNNATNDEVPADQLRVLRLREACTDLARDEETLMVFSTLGGGLTAIDPITSEIRWNIADDPPIQADQEQNIQVPQYLPDPRDGSIYQLSDMGNLKKLPYTIPQLVASAPCRSSDGILYSGKKSDTWFMVDPKSGKRETLMGFGTGSSDATQNRGESEDKPMHTGTSRSIYLGRTQYTVMMFDSLAKGKNVKPWNITFYDYSAHTMTPDISKEYEYLHLTTTSNGNIVTLDRKNGKFLWKHDLTSPVVAAFLLGSEGLLSVPFTTVSDEAFESILEESKTGNVNTIKLFQSLYVGEHRHGLYALPSLVDKDTPRISTTPPIKLLDGPHSASDESDPKMIYLNDVIRKNAGIVLGHYNMPNDGSLQISPSPSKDESSKGLATINHFPDVTTVGPNGYSILTSTNNEKSSAEIGIQTEPLIELKIESTNAFNKTKRIILANGNKIQKFFNDWFMDHPSGKVHQILIVLILTMIAMFWYMCSTMRELKNQSENGSKTYSSSNRSSGSSNINALDLIDLGDGNIRVGKISFNSNEVLGKGCEGTFVFRGTFEERSVAVKRLLPECFTFADREVALLRESDAHENVVRYFCTEQDRQFRYIAVELCAATLQDYTEGERSGELRAQIDVWEVLRQAAAGLSHLHSLNIVHRDIKPQNVLLSLPDINGAVRVMISDFGLCKKLNFGKASFSRRSGVTGTDGWIAPEMMRGQRTTTAVDIFSLGCVYYYVLTAGHHAFGDALKRQHNILTHDYNLSKLKVDTEGEANMPQEPSKYILAEQLIADMIHKDAQCRPLARCISSHPVFWNNKKILAFLQDVSDRVEKLQFHVEPLKSLEKNGRCIVRNDWNAHVDPLITEDLRKYRGYMGASVRDLLRALRNKKHHYHDLTAEVQQILGCLPNDFTNYWINKFPELISHTYHAFTICADEPIFRHYYNKDYHFSRPWYFDADDNLFPTLQQDPKHLTKQSKDGSASPKRVPRTPEKQQQQEQQQQQQQQLIKQRKGIYNFRKTSEADALVGLQRNLDLLTAAERTELLEDDVAGNKRNVFANFRFRRNYGKASNRNYNNYNANAKNDGNKEKSVTWTLPSNQADENN